MQSTDFSIPSPGPSEGGKVSHTSAKFLLLIIRQDRIYVGQQKAFPEDDVSLASP